MKNEMMDIDDNFNKELNETKLPNESKFEIVDPENTQVDENIPEKDIEKEVTESEIIKNDEEQITTKEDDEMSLKQEEENSQISEDQDETVINNDSAYETNEIETIDSQNGSESRLQSANTNDGDVDNDTGEGFPLFNEVDNVDQQEMENIEIERLENDLENPPTPDEDDDFDVVVSAGNSYKTEEGTRQVG
jgi:hypothetical protein